MTDEPCVFCEIVAGREFGEIVHEWHDTFAIHPLNPVTPGHVLVIPKAHVSDFTTSPEVSGRVMACAAELAPLVFPGQEDWNLITSKGRAATQSVFHLHVHVVPRTAGDQLMLPWGTTGNPHDPHWCKVAQRLSDELELVKTNLTDPREDSDSPPPCQSPTCDLSLSACVCGSPFGGGDGAPQ